MDNATYKRTGNFRPLDEPTWNEDREYSEPLTCKYCGDKIENGDICEECAKMEEDT